VAAIGFQRNGRTFLRVFVLSHATRRRVCPSSPWVPRISYAVVSGNVLLSMGNPPHPLFVSWPVSLPFSCFSLSRYDGRRMCLYFLRILAWCNNSLSSYLLLALPTTPRSLALNGSLQESRVMHVIWVMLVLALIQCSPPHDTA